MDAKLIAELEEEIRMAQSKHPKMESMHQALGALIEEILECYICRLAQPRGLLEHINWSRTSIRDEFRACACICIRAMAEIPWTLQDKGKFPD